MDFEREHAPAPADDHDHQAEAHHTPEVGRAPSHSPAEAFERAASGPATSLPYRAEIERAFGMSFGEVRVYLGRAEALGSLGAKAATRGEEIAFADSSPDLHLVAHEVTHVLQQRRGGNSTVLAPATSDAEHEADHMADEVQSGKTAAKPFSPKAASGGTIHLKRYGELNMQGRARVDARAESEFAQKAETFESAMAERIFQSTPVVEVVHEMTRRLSRIVQAWAAHTGRSLNDVSRDEFAFKQGDKYYGAFVMTGKAVQRVLTDYQNQPLRKQLKLVYNAVRNNNLGKWLKVAADEMAHPGNELVREKDRTGTEHNRTVTAGFAQDSGLAKILRRDPTKLGQLQTIATNEKDKNGRHHSLKRSDALKTLPTQDAPRSAKRYHANEGMGPLEQKTVTIGQLGDITTGELRQIEKLHPGTVPLLPGGKPNKALARTHGAQPVPWEQGREGIDVFPNHAFERTANNLHARLDGGISGSTDLMMHAAEHLGFTDLDDKRKMRLAMVAWMILNRDHSFYEIMEAAEGYGVPFVKTDPGNGPGRPKPAYFYEAKENFKPYPVKSLRDVLPEGEFPGYFLSQNRRDTLAERLPNADETTAHLGAWLIQQGAPAAFVNLLVAGRDRTALAALERLAVEFYNFAFVNGNTAANQRTNRWLLRDMRKLPCFLTLIHLHPSHADLLLNALVGRAYPLALSDDAALLQAGQASLPAINAMVGQRRAHLIGHGMTAELANDPVRVPEFILNLFVQLDAMVAGAALVAVGGGAPAQQANLVEIERIRATRVWADLCVHFGDDVHAVGGAPVLALRGLVEHRQAGVGELAHHVSPLRTQVLALGVPEMAVRGLSERSLPLLVALDAAVQVIAGNGVLGPAQKTAALRALSGTHASVHRQLKTYWLPVLGALARAHNIVLTGHDRELQDAATYSQIMRPGQVQLTNLELTNHMVNRSPIWQQKGRQNLVKNDPKYPTANGQPMHQTSQSLHQLHDGELASLNDYSQFGGMGPWQDTIKKRNFGPTNGGSLSMLLPKLEMAASGLDKLPVYQGTVYCGKSADYANKTPKQMQSILKNYPVGKLFNADSFMSTAKSYAWCFAATKAAHDICWVINNVRTGRDIQLVSTNDQEEEVLFAPGAHFVITRVQNDVHTGGVPAKLMIYLDEVTTG